jgi:para-aminobenzoate synthetase
MKHPPEACARIVAAIQRRLLRQSPPLVVALDGGSGAGKSTLAACVAERVDAAWIPVDDFYRTDIPDHHWDEIPVEARLDLIFDWRRLREDVIKPLLAGKPARWYAFDFVSGMRPDGTYGMQSEPTERAPADVILLDGAYTAGPHLADLVDLAVLVDAPVAVRHARQAAREDADFLRRWHALWDPFEAYYFTKVRPRASFDLVVKGT